MIAESIDRNEVHALTLAETAAVMTLKGHPMTEREAKTIEQAALRKLARLPEILKFLPEVFAESKPKPVNFRE